MIILSIEKTKGVIIKSIDYKENDKLIWAYCEELGKITFIAKGAKKSKSKNLALTLPLCFADYIFLKEEIYIICKKVKLLIRFKDY